MNSYKLMLLIAIFVLSIMYIEGGAEVDLKPKTFLPVSMAQLIVNPQKYSNQYVSVDGILSVRKTSSNLYFDKIFYENHSEANRISLSLDGLTEELTLVHGQFVSVRGLFKHYPSSGGWGEDLRTLVLSEISGIDFGISTVYPANKVNDRGRVLSLIKSKKKEAGKNLDAQKNK